MSSSHPPPPSESIQRVLFLSPLVHIYTVPPLTSTKGYTTTSWSPLLSPPTPSSKPEPIITRLRVLETSVPCFNSNNPNDDSSEEEPCITSTLLLEDPSTSALFAAAPYTSPSVVSPVLDSARFFAIRVEGEGGRKAVLGIGFQERGEAGDFVDCLRRVGRVMGWGGDNDGKGGGGDQGRGKGKGGGKEKEKMKDWSLKEGEMIRVEINGVGDKGDGGRIGKDLDGDAEALFSIKPPPSGGDGGGGAGMPFLPPPPSARDVKAERRRSRGRVEPEEGSAAELGFDDGEFGEFQ